MANVYGSVFGPGTVTVIVTATVGSGSADWDLTQLQTDMGNIIGNSRGGEAFLASAVTYYGVFNQTDAVYAFRPTGHADEVSMVLVVDRTQGYTPAVNASIHRVFDSTTYRITDIRPDQAAFECDLRKIR